MTILCLGKHGRCIRASTAHRWNASRRRYFECSLQEYTSAGDPRDKPMDAEAVAGQQDRTSLMSRLAVRMTFGSETRYGTVSRTTRLNSMMTRWLT